MYKEGLRGIGLCSLQERRLKGFLLVYICLWFGVINHSWAFFRGAQHHDESVSTKWSTADFPSTPSSNSVLCK